MIEKDIILLACHVLLIFYVVAPITSEDKIVYAELGEKPVKSLLYKDVIMFLDQFEGISPDVRTHLPNIKKMELDSDDVIICAFPKSGIFVNIVLYVGWGCVGIATAIERGLSYINEYMQSVHITVCVVNCISV